jgi:hypothetical protein
MIKKFFLLLMALVVLAAAVWQGIIALQPAKHKTPVDKATSPHGMEVTAVRQSPMRDSPSPSPVVSPNVATPLSNQETPSSSPQPTVTDPPGRAPVPEKKALSSSLLPTVSSPPLVAPAFPPAVAGSSAIPTNQQVGEQPKSQAYDNAETINFEPTTLTVVRTFVLALPGGGQVEQSVSIPVLYRKGSIALKADQLDQLGVIQSQIQRILDANEELRVASDLLISRQRKGLAGSVPTEVLSGRSSSVLPGGPINAGTSYVNVPQGAVEIAPATKQP